MLLIHKIFFDKRSQYISICNSQGMYVMILVTTWNSMVFKTTIKKNPIYTINNIQNRFMVEFATINSMSSFQGQNQLSKVKI